VRRSLLAAAAISVVAAACTNPLGAGVPECDPTQLTSSMIVQVQAVPDAAYVSCIHGLKTGWVYWDLEARNGKSVYHLDSDRMGLGFLTVEALPSCDPGTANPATIADGEPGVSLFKDVDVDDTLDIVIVPEGPAGTTVTRALDINDQLRDETIEDRATRITISSTGEATEKRIDAAAAGGADVIAISIRDAEEGTLTLRLAGTSAQQELSVTSLDHAIEEIEKATPPPSYRGKWFFVFDGGCVVYTFNAAGPGVGTLEQDVSLALGLFDAAALRQRAKDEGLDI
jgi:hypothetical protein